MATQADGEDAPVDPVDPDPDPVDRVTPLHIFENITPIRVDREDL